MHRSWIDFCSNIYVMYKIVLFYIFLSGLALSYTNIDKNVKEEAAELTFISANDIVKQLFPQIKKQAHEIDSTVFALAFRGYANLLQQGKLNNDSILTIVDYSKSANEKRMWVINLKTQKILFHEWVAHGKNTGMVYAGKFSNKPESHQSSLGFMITGEIYQGKHPNSLKLHGIEKGINTNAYSRGIVIHGAFYASPSFIESNGHLGRSFGCPAVRMEIGDTLVKTLQGGSCVFSYYKNTAYLAKSEYLQKDVDLPSSLKFQ